MSRDIYPNQLCLAFSPHLIHNQIVTAIAFYRAGQRLRLEHCEDTGDVAGVDLWVCSPSLVYKDNSISNCTPAKYLMPLKPDEKTIEEFKAERENEKRKTLAKSMTIGVKTDLKL